MASELGAAIRVSYGCGKHLFQAARLALVEVDFKLDLVTLGARPLQSLAGLMEAMLQVC